MSCRVASEEGINCVEGAEEVNQIVLCSPFCHSFGFHKAMVHSLVESQFNLFFRVFIFKIQHLFLELGLISAIIKESDCFNFPLFVFHQHEHLFAAVIRESRVRGIEVVRLIRSCEVAIHWDISHTFRNASCATFFSESPKASFVRRTKVFRFINIMEKSFLELLRIEFQAAFKSRRGFIGFCKEIIR
ncbi:hypothetical protein D3C72_1673190 [compost metagenome]